MFTWNAMPFARVLLPFMAGIILASYLRLPLPVLIVLVSSASVMLLIAWRSSAVSFSAFRYQWLRGLSLSILLACLGFARMHYINRLEQAAHFSSVPGITSMCVLAETALTEKKKSFKTYAEVIAVSDSSGRSYRVQGKVLLYLGKDSSPCLPRTGDTILLCAQPSEIAAPDNEGMFDYKTWLARQNIFHQVFCRKDHWQCRPANGTSIGPAADDIRSHTLSVLRQYMPSEPERAVAEALLIGYKDNLDQDIVQAFAHTGTLHVLAVSGMHAGIIYLVLNFLTAFLKRSSSGKVLQVILILAGLWFYIAVTGFSASVLRAGFMFTLLALGKLLRRQPGIYNIIFASAFILLLINPQYLFDVGFQLSYIAVLGIVFFQPLVRQLYAPHNRLMQWLWELTAVSLSAQLLTFPLGLYYFHQFPNCFLLSNLVVIPLTTLALAFVLALTALYWIAPVAAVLGKISSMLIALNNDIVAEIDSWPFAYTDGLYVTKPETLLLYLLMAVLSAALMMKKKTLFFASLLTALCLLACIDIRILQNRKREEIVYHRIKNRSAATVFSRGRAYFIADSTLLHDSNAFVFYLKNFYLMKGVKGVVKLEIPGQTDSSSLREALQKCPVF